ncbi:MAG: four helix bundle protein [Kofleriaceae bacterium]
MSAADTGDMVELDYERLEVYQCAIEHLAFVFRALPLIPRGYAALADQWRRAAISISLNIAEGAGKTSEADKMSRYAIARGEAMECGAILDVVRLLNVVPEAERTSARALVVRIVSMLSNLCR